MSLGLHESRQRRRRRARWALVKWVIALALIVTAGLFAYETGTVLAERKVSVLEREIAELTEQVETLRSENAELQAQAILTEQRLEAAEQRYARDVPTGPLAELLERLRAKLEAGVTLERLAFLVEAADNPENCAGDPETKRFLVQTPLYQGANDSVSFADGTVTVTASGESAVDAQGRVEAWFDPAKPISLRMTRTGGEGKQASGKLPLHASFVAGDTEHRFTVTAGERGFVQVTAEACDFP